jgi:hypothetical protein
MARVALGILLAAVCVGAALAGCASNAGSVTAPLPPRGAPPLRAGLVVNALDAGRRRGAELAHARALGVRWIREELRWNQVETRPGHFRWQRFDALLADAAARGLHVLPLLIGTPWWAGSGMLALPQDPAAFGAFAAQTAARYGPGGAFWRARPRLDARLAPVWFELWNEPYMPSFSTGGIDPARYAQMVGAATTAGHAANPRTRWLMAADLEYRDAAGQQRNWLAAIAAADPGLLARVDGVAVHPYSFDAPGTKSSVALAFRFDRIDAIAGELSRYGAAKVPLWITEIGWSTCASRPDCTSEHDQAQRIADVFTRVRRRPLASRVQAVFVYDLRDFAGRAAGDREGHFGLLRDNGSRKPAWSVVRREAVLALR